MAITHLKTATKTPETETDAARAVVTEMLAAIESGGEQAVRDYALKLDKWDGAIVLDQAAIAERIRDVPQAVKDDYLDRSPDTAGSELLFRFSNLNPGRYNVTVFEGRTTDGNGQYGRVWVDDVNGKNGPAQQNTGDFAGTRDEGGTRVAVPEGNPRTISVDLAAGQYLWYAHMEDNSGGFSGIIIQSVTP